MLTDKVSLSFSREVRARGAAYAAGGLVSEVRVDRDSVRAVVSGSDDYDVTVRLRDRAEAWTLRASCTCPYMEDRGELCKHVWAVLEAAERRVEAKWGAPPRSVSISARAPLDLDADEDSSMVASRPAIRLSGRTPLPAPAVKRPGKPKPPAWKRLLDETRPDAWGGWSAGGKKRGGVITDRLGFVIDSDRSRLHGALVVEVMLSGGNGPADDPARLKRFTIGPDDVGRIQNPEDRTLCALLVGAARPGRESFVYSSYDHRPAGEQRTAIWQLDPRMVPVVAPIMAATGRLFWRRDERSIAERARWSADAPWTLALDLLPENEHQALFRPVVQRGADCVPLEQVVATDGEPGAVLWGDELAPLHVAGGRSAGMLSWARTVAGRPRVRVEREQLAGLLSALEKRQVRLPVRWPEAWNVKRLAGVRPRTRLVLSTQRRDGRAAGPGSLLAEIGFEYQGTRVDAEAGRYAPVTLSDGSDAMVERDLDVERRALERFIELGGRRDGFTGLCVPVKGLPKLAAGLLGEGWEVVGESAVYRQPGAVNIRVSSGIDWFDVEGSVTFGDGQAHAAIGAVLEALRKGERFISLGDGSLGLLPQEWLSQHGRWLGLGREEDGRVRFSRAQLSLVDALLAEMPEATCDRQTAAARRKLAAFEGIVPGVEPQGFRGELRAYQRFGLGWLRFLADFGLGGCLADDMGLGKTVQVLAHMAERRNAGDRGPWLVVAPKSLVFNWAREAERFTPGLRIVQHTGPERPTSREDLEAADLVLTTYATMRLDIELLRSVEFACIVLDEAQFIKNASAQASKAARLLRGRRRLALSGTPVENRLEDLWSIFEFLNPGMLGGSRAFREAVKAGTGSGAPGAADSAASASDQGTAAPGMEMLRRALRPLLLRRTKALVAPELPARSEQTVRCELEGKHRKLYDGLRAHYRQQLLGRVEREGMNKSRMHVLEALLRLRQAACHPGLIEPKAAESAKMETLVEMLEELATQGHKALVFSQFTSLLALVKAELDRRSIGYEELDGGTSAAERERRVDRFQKLGVAEGGKGVFLISLKAGGVGLNLTAAGYVFLLDPWWNPAVEAQAIDRTHRIGQDKSVMAYRLIASGTVEERILELQERKRELAAAIVCENDGPLSAMTREDLEWLLS